MIIDQDIIDQMGDSMENGTPAPKLGPKAIALIALGLPAVVPLTRLAARHIIPFTKETAILEPFMRKKDWMTTGLMAASGLAIPYMYNTAYDIKDDEKRREFLNKFRKHDLLKTSSYAGAGEAALVGIKYLGKGLKDLARGVTMPIKGKTVGDTALSIGSKALVGYGAYKTGKKIAKTGKEYDYSTYLRNQVLAGNIKPGELTEDNINTVRRMGVYG